MKNSLSVDINMPTPKPERLSLWDNAKFILMTLVVIGHFADTYESSSALLRGVTLFLYSFHMPAFIFISGLFCKSAAQSRDFPLKKAAVYLKLFLLVQILIYIAVKLTVYPPYKLRLLTINTAAWFGFALFAFYALTWIISGVKGIYTLPAAIAISCFCGYLENLGDFLVLSRILVFYPFFLAGYLTPLDRIAALLERRVLKYASAVFLAAIASAIYLSGAYAESPYTFLMSLFRGRFSFSAVAAASFAPAVPWFAVRGTHLIFSAAMTLAVFAVIPAGASFLTKLGQRTLSVYAFHMPVLYALRQINIDTHLTNIFGSGWAAAYLLTAVAASFILFAEPLAKLVTRIIRSAGKQQNITICK